MIYIVGLGPGSINDINLGTYEILKTARKNFFRTEKHPVVPILKERGIKYEALDRFYINSDDFDAVYTKIVDFIIHNREGDLVYAVPGHPLVAEKSVKMLIEQLKTKNIDYKIISGMSFIDSMFTSLEIDPSEGFLLIDALNIDKTMFTDNQHLIITQVYDSFIASDIKLKLQEFYKDDDEILLINGAGIESEEKIIGTQLENIDRINWDFNHLTSIFIKKNSLKKYADINDLLVLVKILRENCPWDKAQTSKSLIPMLIEEAHELEVAIENNDIENLVEELGDVLLHIIMQTQLGKEEELFDFSEVTDGIVKKMIRRHPHIFGDKEAKTLDEVNKLWNYVKKQEKNGKK